MYYLTVKGKGIGGRQGLEKQIRSLEPGDKQGSRSLTIIVDGWFHEHQWSATETLVSREFVAEQEA